jgi:hypothetical protein
MKLKIPVPETVDQKKIALLEEIRDPSEGLV